MKAQFPCVISVIEKINEPRYPSFKGIMAAKKKPMAVHSLSEIGLGKQDSWSAVVDATPRAAKAAGVKVVDDGAGGEALLNFLVEKKFA